MSNKKDYDYLIKLLMLGDSGVGKSSLLTRFSEDTFTESFITTIGIDFKFKTIEIDGKKVKLQIWDAAGQERFRSITNAYYRGCHGIILVYDSTDEKTFLNVKMWNEEINRNTQSVVPHGGGDSDSDGNGDGYRERQVPQSSMSRILVGNKYDLVSELQVSEQKGKDLGAEYKIQFVATSAKSNSNVTESFNIIAREIIKKMEDGTIAPSLKKPTVVVMKPVVHARKPCCEK